MIKDVNAFRVFLPISKIFFTKYKLVVNLTAEQM